MKKISLFMSAILVLALLTACSSNVSSGSYTVVKGNTVYTVDPENGTISDGTYTYGCDVTSNGTGYKLTITYPDGSTFFWNNSGNSGFGGWSEDYDPDRYADGFTLKGILEEKRPVEKSSNHGAIAIALMMLGMFQAVAPRISWYLGYGWRYKDAEPSDAALALGRGGGILAIVIGVILLFV